MKTAVDIMGGDGSPENVIEGCIKFSRVFPEDKLVLCCTPEIERQDIFAHLSNNKNITFKYFSDVINMDEHPAIVKKDKTNSTLAGAVSLVRDKKADCSFSCGNSGAVILSSMSILGQTDAEMPPFLISFIPAYGKDPVALTDAGATGNSFFSSEVFFKIAESTCSFYKKMFGKNDPSVRMLNIGSEPWKGTGEHKKIYKMLSESGMNFKGNIEGDKILSADTDIVLTDGFTGNTVLKLLESFYDILSKFKNIKDCNIENNYLNFLLDEFRYDAIGGAPLLGVNGKVVLGHGKSNPEAVYSGLKLCREYVMKSK